MGTHHADRSGGRRPGGLPPWAWAVLLSLAAHALIFAAVLVVRMPTLQLPVTPPPGAKPAPVVFRVGVWTPSAGEAPAPSAPAAPAPPRRAVPAPVPAAAPSEAPAVDAPAPDDLVNPREEVGGAGPDEVRPGSETVGSPSGSGTGEANAVDSAGGGPSGAGGTTTAAGPGPDVEGLVLARLTAGAERCYPAAARRYQQRGTAEVHFCVDAAGRAVDASLVTSSGSSLLDAAVSGCVLPASSPFPASAQGHCFTVPVRFGAR